MRVKAAFPFLSAPSQSDECTQAAFLLPPKIGLHFHHMTVSQRRRQRAE
jgi:hypothetical protein